MTNRYVGIDPGLDGGVAVLGPAGQILEVGPMPTRMVSAGKRRAKRKIDFVQLASMLETYSQDSRAYVELVGAMPGQGVTSMFTFGEGFGGIQGVLAGLSIPYDQVAPRKWKQRILDTLPHTKQGAIGFCQVTWPGNNLVLKGCRVSHDGIADALCIAEFCRLTHKAP